MEDLSRHQPVSPPTKRRIISIRKTARLHKVLVAGSHLLRDPFSDVTRERQKYVLIVSTIVLCLRLAVVNIDKVEAEWFHLTVNPQRIVYVLALATIYLTILFAIGAKQELNAAKYDAQAGVLPLRAAVQELLDESSERGKKIAEIIRRDAVWNKLEGKDPSRERKMGELGAKRQRLEAELEQEQARLNEVFSKVQAAVGSEKETLLNQFRLGSKVAQIGEQLDKIDADLRPLVHAEWRSWRRRVAERQRWRTTGQASYKCEGQGGQRFAYAYARTNLSSNIWTVATLVSFLAPADGVLAARDIVMHCSQTFRLNPQWVRKQQQEDAYGLQYQRARQQQRLAALGQQVQQFQQQMQAMRNQVSAFERGQERQAGQVSSFDQLLKGVTPTVDSYGNEREVWTGPYANYWKNGRAKS